MTTPPMYPQQPAQPYPAPPPPPPGWGNQYPTPQPGQVQPQPYQAPPPAPVYPTQPPQPPQAPGAVDLNARIPHGSPNFPQELWGKPLSEAFRYYAIMRQEFIENRQRQAQAPQQPQQPQYGQQPQQPQAPGQPQPPIDPVRRMVNEALREALPQALAPVMQPLQAQSVQGIYDRVSREFPDWDRYAQDVQQALGGADASMLLNPDVWRAAYFHAKGKAATFGGRPQPLSMAGQPGWNPGGQQPQAPQPQAYLGPDGQWYVQPQQPQQPQAQPWAPPPSGYFVEGPTPQPNFAGGTPDDPRDEIMAARFGMPVEAYRSMKKQQGTNFAPAPPDNWGRTQAAAGGQSNGR